MKTRGSKLPTGFWAGSTKPQRKPRRMAKPARKAVAKVVKGVIGRMAETKMKGLGVSYTTNGAPTVTSLTRLLPQIQEGSADSQRTGNKISPVSLYAKGILNINLTADSQQVMLRVLCLTSKAFKSQGDPLTQYTNDFAGIFNDGTTSGITGAWTDGLLPVNRDSWNVHYDRIIPLVKGTGDIDGPSIHGSITCPAKSFARFGFKVPTPKVLHYQSDGDQSAENFDPLLLVIPFYPSSDQGNVLATTPYRVMFHSQLKFKDL